MGCGVLCAVDPHAVGAWGVGSAVGITPSKQALYPAAKSYKTMIPTSMHPNRRALSCVCCLEIVWWVAF